MASGSPRKRFDKAVKIGAEAIVAFALREGEVARRIRAEGDVTALIEQALAD